MVDNDNAAVATVPWTSKQEDIFSLLESGNISINWFICSSRDKTWDGPGTGELVLLCFRVPLSSPLSLQNDQMTFEDQYITLINDPFFYIDYLLRTMGTQYHKKV